jgi:predicted small lipoprotein YifL
MKKICLSTLVLFSLFLTACGTKPSLTLPEMETAYEQSLQTTLDTFQSYLTDLGDTQETQTNLTLTFPKSSNLQGNVDYASTKYSQEQSEKSNLSFNVNLKNIKETTPIIASGSIDTLYTDQKMHFNIQDFNLFMGGGNAEVNFLNLLAKQLAHKRILLDQNETIGVSIIETPDYSLLLSQLSDFFTSKNLTTTAENNQSSSEIETTIASVNENHIASAQSLYTLLANLFSLPLLSGDYTLDTTNHNVALYTTSTNNGISGWRTTYYLVGDQHLQIATNIDTTHDYQVINLVVTTWNEAEGIHTAENL